ncbi:MAG: protein-disulfide reductase DsbD N-terminal domain-containing protein [Gemmataceae bacterium]|nr:protein-disulfide reductase DsbD N-terminal domain-containing protein [Gemmataceae bacterium]
MFRTATLIWLALVFSAGAQPKTTETVVKVSAKAEKPSADGTQTVVFTVRIDNAYHLYANPVKNPDLDAAQTKLTVTGAELVKVEYPPGKLIVDKIVGDYAVYEGEIKITARVRKKVGATGPVESTIKCQACSEKACLPIGNIKTRIELP